jgi:hypothetical protein
MTQWSVHANFEWKCFLLFYLVFKCLKTSFTSSSTSLGFCFDPDKDLQFRSSFFSMSCIADSEQRFNLMITYLDSLVHHDFVISSP